MVMDLLNVTLYHSYNFTYIINLILSEFILYPIKKLRKFVGEVGRKA